MQKERKRLLPLVSKWQHLDSELADIQCRYVACGEIPSMYKALAYCGVALDAPRM